MTEYDYSPAAYERYCATQDRIARWVDYTQRFSPGNPFIPPNPSPSPAPLANRSEYRQSRPRELLTRMHSEPLPETVSQSLVRYDGNQHIHHGRQHSSSSFHPSRHHELTSSDSHSSRAYRRPATHTRGHHRSSPTHSHRSTTDQSSSVISSTASQSSSDESWSIVHTPTSTYSHQHHFHPPIAVPPAGTQLGYSLVYPNPSQPTIVQPLKHQPIVIPMNGGRAGYVVVPPIGMSVTVVQSNPSSKKHTSLRSKTRGMMHEDSGSGSEEGGQSFFGRLTKRSSRHGSNRSGGKHSVKSKIL